MLHKNISESPLYRVIDKVLPGEKEAVINAVFQEKGLHIKFGTDATGKDLHFGHAVNLWVLKAMKEQGHKIDLIIGDVTAKIGDPTGRKAERPELSDKEIIENSKLFLNQIGLILPVSGWKSINIHYNSSWYKNISILQFMDEVLRHVTISQLTQRNDIKQRMQNNIPVFTHELLYQLFQGYDSVHLKTNIALSGDDQLTNELMGRELQKIFNQKPQTIITTKLTPGIDGKGKQSKSVGNYIGLNHPAEEQFRRIMSIPDNIPGTQGGSLIKEFFDIYTDLPTSQINSLINQYRNNPRELKMILAQNMIIRYHSQEKINETTQDYLQTSKGQISENIPTLSFKTESIDIMAIAITHLNFTSKTTFRNLIQQGTVEINQKKISINDLEKGSLLIDIRNGAIVKYGKNKWIKIIKT